MYTTYKARGYFLALALRNYFKIFPGGYRVFLFISTTIRWRCTVSEISIFVKLSMPFSHAEYHLILKTCYLMVLL